MKNMFKVKQLWSSEYGEYWLWHWLFQPYDEEFLNSCDPPIKFLAFHSYIRKLTSGVDKYVFIISHSRCEIKIHCERFIDMLQELKKELSKKKIIRSPRWVTLFYSSICFSHCCMLTSSGNTLASIRQNLDYILIGWIVQKNGDLININAI